MKVKLYILLLSLGLSVLCVSCITTTNKTGAEPENSESTELSSNTEVESPAPDIPSGQPPEPVITDAWKKLLEDHDISDESIVCSYSTLLKNPEIDKMPELYPRDSVVVLGDLEAPDAQLYSFTLKYADMQVDVYSLPESYGGSGKDGEEPGEKLYSETVNGDQIIFLLSGFVDEEVSPPCYRLPYQITFRHGKDVASLRPTAYQTYHYDIVNMSAYINLIADYTLGNPPDEEPEETGVQPLNTTQTTSFSATDYSYVSYFGSNYSQNQLWEIENKLGESKKNLLAEYIRSYHKEQGYGDAYHVSHSYTDKNGNNYVVIGNTFNQDLYVVKIDADGENCSAIQTISSDYEADNRLMPLPFSDYFLKINSSSLSDCNLVRYGSGRNMEGDPISDEKIFWLMNPIVNPNEPREQLYFGYLGDRESYWEPVENPQYIVLKKRDNAIVGWYMTGSLRKNSNYINTFTTASVIAGNSLDDFTTAMPYKSSFATGYVQVYFPESYVTYSFDFNTLGVSANVQYDESFRDGMYNSFVYSTADGRYELWKMNERWFHESSTYGYAVYDTRTKQLIDFYDEVPDFYYTVSFLDNQSAAVISQTRDYIDGKRHTESQIYVFDLSTMRAKQIHLPIDQALSESDTYQHLRRYVWDSYRNQHIVVTTENYGNFILYYFSADGDFKHSQRTDIYQFGGKFVIYPEEIYVVGDGKLYLKDNLGDAGGILYNMDTGESEKGYYLPIERLRIERLIQNEMNGIVAKSPYGSSRAGYELEVYLRDLPKNQNGEEIYGAILEYIPESSDGYLCRYPGTSILYSKLSGNLYSPQYSEDEAFSVRIQSLNTNQDMPAPELWLPDGGGRFLIGVARPLDTAASSLFAIEVTEEGLLSDQPVAVSNIYPLNITRNPSKISIMEVSDLRYTDMRFELQGNALTLFYRNKKLDKSLPFAVVVYRNDMFEILVFSGSSEK